jgi:hypothetical protein
MLPVRTGLPLHWHYSVLNVKLLYVKLALYRKFGDCHLCMTPYSRRINIKHRLVYQIISNENGETDINGLPYQGIMSLRRAERVPSVRCGIFNVTLYGSGGSSRGNLFKTSGLIPNTLML